RAPRPATRAPLRPPPTPPRRPRAANPPAGRATAGPRRHRPPRIILVALALFAVGGAAWAVGLLDVRELRRALPWSDGQEGTALTLYGNVDVRQVNLSFKVEGRIETLAGGEGGAVKAGQVIATPRKRDFHDW